MMIVMEGAKALVARNSETESLGDPLNGEVAELLYLESVHHFDFDFPVRYSSVFEYRPVWLLWVMNLRQTHWRN